MSKGFQYCNDWETCKPHLSENSGSLLIGPVKATLVWMRNHSNPGATLENKVPVFRNLPGLAGHPA